MPKEPDFPGFQACMNLMRRRDPMKSEEGFSHLRRHAGEYVDDLVAEFRKEENADLQPWLLELLGEARAPELMPLFVEQLYGPDERLRWWAIVGLKVLDTKEARRVLWEARTYTSPDPVADRTFHEMLEAGDKLRY